MSRRRQSRAARPLRIFCLTAFTAWSVAGCAMNAEKPQGPNEADVAYVMSSADWERAERDTRRDVDESAEVEMAPAEPAPSSVAPGTVAQGTGTIGLGGQGRAAAKQFMPAPMRPDAKRRAEGRALIGGVVAPPPMGPPKKEALADVEGGNSFEKHAPNTFTQTSEDRLSTFAIDVDTASYSLARRYLNGGSLPPHAAVRVEEFVNYFKYKYAPPKSGAFAVHLDGAPSPFGRGKHLLKVGVQGKSVSKSQRKPANLVFLVDVSGSMASGDKLALVQESLKVLTRNLNENDLVSLVTYAGRTAEVLAPTPATDVKRINAAIDSLHAGGGTSMGSGFQRAYENAMKKVGGGFNSRVIVLTDGDTNIGPNLTAASMLESVRKYVSEGVTLSTVGFGMGNYRDDLMEKLADSGNGNCFYIDSIKEARKVFETQIAGTLEVIAKDVKIQVDFNPETVKSYRLVGYENRDIADKDFRNDKVDAGEIGAGHNVTALYEVELTGAGGDLATVRIRAKSPTGSVAREQAFAFGPDRLYATIASAPADFRFATAVAGTADILRGNPAAEGWSLALAQSLAEGATDGLGDRKEFVSLVDQARRLMGGKNVSAAR